MAPLPKCPVVGIAVAVAVYGYLRFVERMETFAALKCALLAMVVQGGVSLMMGSGDSCSREACPLVPKKRAREQLEPIIEDDEGDVESRAAEAGTPIQN